MNYAMLKNTIKPVWERTKTLFKKMRLGSNALWFVLSLLFGLLMFYLLTVVIGPFQPMSRFPAAFLLIYIGVACLMFLDKVYFNQINTIQAIKENNIAYALIILAYAIIIAAVLTTV